MTQEDLNQIRAIVREELAPVREEFGSRVAELSRRMDLLERAMDRIAGTSAALAGSVAALHRWANRLDKANAEMLKRVGEELKKETLARYPQVHGSPEDIAKRWLRLPNDPPS